MTALPSCLPETVIIMLLLLPLLRGLIITAVIVLGRVSLSLNYKPAEIQV